MGTPGDRSRFENLSDTKAFQLEDNQSNRTSITSPTTTATTVTSTSMTVITHLPHFNSSFYNLHTPTSTSTTCEPKETEPPDHKHQLDDSYYEEVKFSHTDLFRDQTAIDLEVAGPSGLQTPKNSNNKSKANVQVAKKLKKSPTKKQFTCAVCQKCFQSPTKLAKHQQIHGNSSPFKCEHCKKSFTSKFKLVRHVLIHSDRRPFSCTICERTFHRKDHLKNHIKVHSPCKTVHVCEKPACRKEYTSLISFKKHLAFHAAEDGALDCLICEQSFASKEAILYHLKVHAGSRTVKNPEEKKYPCDHCERKFFTRKDVRRHMVVHTGRRDFLCQFCPQRFGRKDHLVRHIKKSHSASEAAATSTSIDETNVKAEPETSCSTAMPSTSSYIKSENEEESNLSNAESFATNLDLDTLLPAYLTQPHTPAELTELGCEVLDVIPPADLEAAADLASERSDELFEGNSILHGNVMDFITESDDIGENTPLPAFSQIFQPHPPPPSPR